VACRGVHCAYGSASVCLPLPIFYSRESTPETHDEIEGGGREGQISVPARLLNSALHALSFSEALHATSLVQNSFRQGPVAMLPYERRFEPPLLRVPL
jgi:hypothetical protein